MVSLVLAVCSTDSYLLTDQESNLFLAFTTARRSAGEDLADLNNAFACNHHCQYAIGWRTSGIN